jgi:hypothetical protein
MLSSPWLELQRRDRDPTWDFSYCPTRNDARVSTASSSLRPAPFTSVLHRHRLLFTVRPPPNLGFFSRCRRTTMSRICRAVRAVSMALRVHASSASLALHVRPRPNLPLRSSGIEAFRVHASSAPFALHGETATQLAAPFARYRGPPRPCFHRHGSSSSGAIATQLAIFSYCRRPTTRAHRQRRPHYVQHPPRPCFIGIACSSR